MKSWRERIAEARARGKFTEEDRTLAQNYATCAVGELVHGDARAYSVFVEANLPGEKLLAGMALSGHFTNAVLANGFSEAERLLDAIEDRALQLKRAQG